MRVGRIKIKGFRSIREIDTTTCNLTSFVGENSSGKSTILQAVDLLLSSKKITELDFHNIPGYKSNSFEILCTFESISENDKKSLFDLFAINFNSLNFRKKAKLEDLKITTSIDIPVPKNKLLDISYINGRTKPEYEDAVKNNILPSTIFDTGKNIGDIKEGIAKYIKDNIDKIEYSGVKERILKTSEMKQLLVILPEALYVPAFDDINKQVSYSKTNIFGKLLEQIFKNLSNKNDLTLKTMNTQINNLTKKFRRDGSSRIEEFEKLESQLSGYVEAILPESKAILTFDIPPIDELLKKYFSIELDDGIATPVEKKGHGAQRTLVWSLLRTYLDNLSDRGNSRVLFLVEEPELYLHPQAQRVMLGVLRELSNFDQVIYSTHSPVFIGLDHPDEIRLVRKRNTQTVIDMISKHTLEHSKNEVRFLTWLDDNQAELFFAKSVLLVEGDTERILMEDINQYRPNGMSLDELGCQVIVTNGKFSMPFYCNLLMDIKIPFFVVYDHDSSRGQHKDANTHINNAVGRSNKSMVLADKHVFYPYFEKDWGLNLGENSKVEHILGLVNSWKEKGSHPSKYDELSKKIYTFAVNARKQK